MIGLIVQRVRPLVAIGIAASLSSCSATEETASRWAKAPIGYWQTRITRSDTAGPGNSYVAETVQLRQGSDGTPVNVLTLAENNGPARLLLSWSDATHLVIAYSNADVLFQAVRFGDATIKTREL